MSEKSATYRESDGSAVEMVEAKELWAVQARATLERVAGEYHGLISYGELAEEAQQRSGVRTTRLMHSWMADVLTTVTNECTKNGEPLLSSLCIRQDGTIGAAYTAALTETFGDDAPDDVEGAAAEERMKCYRHFGAVMPADGGRPGYSPQVGARRHTAARKAQEEHKRPTCPHCFLALPATGKCYCQEE